MAAAAWNERVTVMHNVFDIQIYTCRIRDEPEHLRRSRDLATSGVNHPDTV